MAQSVSWSHLCYKMPETSRVGFRNGCKKMAGRLKASRTIGCISLFLVLVVCLSVRSWTSQRELNLVFSENPLTNNSTVSKLITYTSPITLFKNNSPALTLGRSPSTKSHAEKARQIRSNSAAKTNALTSSTDKELKESRMNSAAIKASLPKKKMKEPKRRVLRPRVNLHKSMPPQKKKLSTDMQQVDDLEGTLELQWRMKRAKNAYRPPFQKKCVGKDQYFLHWACDLLSVNASTRRVAKEESVFRSALRPFCDLPAMHPIFEARVRCSFTENYNAIYDSGGWSDEAYVAFTKGRAYTDYYNMSSVLIESTHAMSTRPIIFFCIDSACLWDPKKYPNLVIIDIFTTRMNEHLSLDFSKWVALILSRVRTGVQLDSDMMLMPSADILFAR